MIRFACPRCKSVLESPDHKAGSKVACPKCQQRLLIPTLPRSKTILAPLVAHIPHPGIPQPSQEAAKTDSVPPTTPGLNGRWFQWPRRRSWLVLTVLLPALLLVGLGIRLVITGGYVRPADQVPENRTDARTDEEELVKRYIVNNAGDDGDKVRFLAWGPHMSKQELLDLAKEGGISRMSEIFPLEELLHEGTFLIHVGIPSRAEKTELVQNVSGPIEHTAVREIVRVRCTGPQTLRQKSTVFHEFSGFSAEELSADQATIDMLFIVYNKRVFPYYGPVRYGRVTGSDGWKQNLRKVLSRAYPGIKPPS